MRLGIRVLLHALRKPFMPPLKRRRRSADRRTTGSAPPQQRKPASVCGEHHRFLPRTMRDQSGGALAFRRPTAVMRRGTDLDSAPGRASWNHRIQTGGPSPAPVQPAPGSPVTRRTVDAQNRPEPRCMAALPGTAPAPPRSTLAKASFVERDFIRWNVTVLATHVNSRLFYRDSLGRACPGNPRLVDEPWPNGAQ